MESVELECHRRLYRKEQQAIYITTKLHDNYGGANVISQDLQFQLSDNRSDS